MNDLYVFGEEVSNNLSTGYGLECALDEITLDGVKAELIFLVEGYPIHVVLQDTDYMDYYSVDDIVEYIVELLSDLLDIYTSRLN